MFTDTRRRRPMTPSITTDELGEKCALIRNFGILPLFREHSSKSRPWPRRAERFGANLLGGYSRCVRSFDDFPHLVYPMRQIRALAGCDDSLSQHTLTALGFGTPPLQPFTSASGMRSYLENHYSAEDGHRIFREATARIVQSLGVSSGVLAIDASDLYVHHTSKTYEGSAYTKRHWRDKRRRRGYKLHLCVWCGEGIDLIVGATVSPLTSHESNHVAVPLDDAAAVLPNARYSVVFDAGYIGEKTMIITRARQNWDFIIRGDCNLNAYKFHRRGSPPLRQRDAHGLIDFHMGHTYGNSKMDPPHRFNSVAIPVRGLGDLPDFHENPKAAKDDMLLLLTSHPIRDSDEARSVAEMYRGRWNIEEVFGALKSNSGWRIGQFPSTSWDGVCFSIYMTCLTYNIDAYWRACHPPTSLKDLSLGIHRRRRADLGRMMCRADQAAR
jgi:DDE family transposase